MRTLDGASVKEALGFVPGSAAASWVDELESLGPPQTPVVLDPPTARDRLDLLGIGADDAAEVLSTLPSPQSSPEWWWCLEREVDRLVAAMGDPDKERGRWPAFEGSDVEPERRCHFVHVALAVVPFTLSYYADLGVPEELALGSLSDVRRHMRIHREVFGLAGVDAAWWVTLCLRGEIADLGLLQYNRFRLASDPYHAWYSEEEQEARGPGFQAGDDCLGIHIPDGHRLDPDEVADSLATAAGFFERYYPVSQRRIATCSSWLLDDQLASYLPPRSNILSFQRFFELVPGSIEGDDNVLQFVFRVPLDTDLNGLPQRTTLERAVVAHLRAGRHWKVRTGWLDLPAQSSSSDSAGI